MKDQDDPIGLFLDDDGNNWLYKWIHRWAVAALVIIALVALYAKVNSNGSTAEAQDEPTQAPIQLTHAQQTQEFYRPGGSWDMTQAFYQPGGGMEMTFEAVQATSYAWHANLPNLWATSDAAWAKAQTPPAPVIVIMGPNSPEPPPTEQMIQLQVAGDGAVKIMGEDEPRDSHTYIATPFDDTIPRTPWLADQGMCNNPRVFSSTFARAACLEEMGSVGRPSGGAYLGDSVDVTHPEDVDYGAYGLPTAVWNPTATPTATPEPTSRAAKERDDEVVRILCEGRLLLPSECPTPTPSKKKKKPKQSNPTATPNDRGGVHHSDAERRSRALAQCYPGGAGLSNQIVAGEANGINMGAQKAQFRRQFGNPCRCGICVH